MSKYNIQQSAMLDELQIAEKQVSTHTLTDHKSTHRNSCAKSIHLPSTMGLFAEECVDVESSHSRILNSNEILYVAEIDSRTKIPEQIKNHHYSLGKIINGLKKVNLSNLRERKSIKNNLGLIYMLLAALSWSLMSLCIKILSISHEPLPTFQIIWARSLVTGIIAGMQIKMKNLELKGPQECRILLLLRGLTGFCGMSFGFMALTVLSVGDAVALSFTAPIFTGIAGHFLLNEPWQFIDVIAAFLSLIGVAFIARPPFLFPNSTAPSSVNNFGIMLALLGALSASGAFIVMRKIGKRADPLQTTFYFSVIPFFLCLMSLPFMGSSRWIIPAHFATYFWFSCLTCTGYIGQMLFARALQVETAAKASTYNFAQVLYSFIFEAAVFGKIPSMWSITGAGIIGFSIIGMTIAKISKQPTNNLPK